MLGHALHESQAFGFRLKYANKNNLKEWRNILGTDDFESTIKGIMSRRTSPNGVFGIKVHHYHLKAFGSFSSLLHLLPDPYFVFISRQDVVSQAVSMAIAEQTGNWITGQVTNPKLPVYNFDQINFAMRRIIKQNAAWKYTLAGNGCRYLEVSFEKLRLDTRSAIQEIADFMQVELDPKSIPDSPITKRQSKELNEQ